MNVESQKAYIHIEEYINIKFDSYFFDDKCI